MEWQFLSASRPSPKDKRMTKVDITATRQAPRPYTPIGMAAHVVALLSRGGLRVRLVNNHELDVPAASGRQTDISRLGDVVFIEWAAGRRPGWRLRPPFLPEDAIEPDGSLDYSGLTAAPEPRLKAASI